MQVDGNSKLVGPDSPKNADQSPTGPTTAKRVTVQEAAEALGITVEAVRARIKRGKLHREKGEGGTVYVWLEADQTQPDQNQTHDRTRYHEDQTHDRIRPDQDQTTSRAEAEAETELIDSLKDQLAYMREQLAEEREARRRADTIIVQLTHANATLAQRVPELEPPTESRESPETPVEEPASTHAPTEPERPFTEEEPPRRRSWWREFLGME
jgi:hypothetical protein